MVALNLPESEVNPETPQSLEKRNISISVNDGTNPVSGVVVSLVKNNQTVASSTTGSAGGCTLSNVEDGSYIITATKDGFDEYSDSIVTSSDNVSLVIKLTAKPSP